MRVISLCLGFLLAACTAKPTYETHDTPSPTGQTHPRYPSENAYSLLYSIVKTVQDPKWFRDPAIVGRCSASLDPTTNLQIPCQNVVVTAIDDKGQEKSRAPVETGRFRLSVDTGKAYYVKVIAPLYKMSNDSRIGPLHAGETIDLRLTRK